MLILLSICFAEPVKIAAVNHGLRFETSMYGALETIGKNVYIQTDIALGYKFHRHGILSLESCVKYRNYSLVTTEFLTAAIGGNIRENEGRIGIAVGCQTYRVGGYRDIIPAGGAELQYIRYFSTKISFRVKERIAILASEEKTVFTATLFGLGISF